MYVYIYIYINYNEDTNNYRGYSSGVEHDNNINILMLIIMIAGWIPISY